MTAPSAALLPDAARGWQVDGGLRPGPARDGRVYVLYGSRPDLVGWAATVAGRPGSELLSRVRHLNTPARLRQRRGARSAGRI